MALFGDDNPAMTKHFLSWHQEFREKETIRLCLKHFRQQNYLEAFESLQKKTKIQLEDPLLTGLHSTLVNDGDYVKTEELIKNCLQDGIFSDYIRRQQQTARDHIIQQKTTRYIRRQHTTTEDNIIQHTTTYYNRMQHKATEEHIRQQKTTESNRRQHKTT